MSTDQPNPALLAAARAYAEATWDYDGPYRTSRDRENHIGADAASTAERPWFAALWEAGIAEGRRQAVELVSSLLGHDLVLDRAADVDSVGFLSSAIVAAREQGRRQATEGQRREWGLQWVPVPGHPSDHPDHIAVFHEESEAREAEPEWRAHRLVARLVGPWEPDGQPEAACSCPMTDVTQVGDDGGEGIRTFVQGYDPACPACAAPRPAPASGGVVEPSPLTAEEATPDCGVPNNPGGVFRPGTCKLAPGHPGWHEDGGLSWLRDREELKRVVERDEHAPAWKPGDRFSLAEVRWPHEARSPYARRQHDPGVLIEEPDLYEQGEDGAR